MTRAAGRGRRDVRACASSAPSACALERGGRELLDGEREDVAVGAEALEGPGEVRLDRHADGAAGGDDAEQDARAVGALGAAGEQHVEAELGEVLELALGRRVVDRYVGERPVDRTRESGCGATTQGGPVATLAGCARRGGPAGRPPLDAGRRRTVARP